MNNFEKTLLYLILVMQLFINILMSHKLIITYNNFRTLNDRVNDLIISERIEYDDILEKFEIIEGVKRGVY